MEQSDLIEMVNGVIKQNKLIDMNFSNKYFNNIFNKQQVLTYQLYNINKYS